MTPPGTTPGTTGSTTPGITTPATPGPPRLSQAQAARACGVDVSTIRRRRHELDAIRDTKTGGWLISIPSLVAAGLLDRTTPPDATPGTTPSTVRVPRGTPPPDATPTPPPTPDAAGLRAALDAAEQRARDAETRAREAEHRAALAEALATERAEALAAERAMIRMITAQPQPAHEPAQERPAHEPARERPAPPVTVEPASPGFWKRWRSRH